MAEDVSSISLHVDDFAEAFGITARRVHQLAEDGYLPKAVKNRYVLVPTVQGYIRYLKASLRRGGVESESGGEGDDESLDLTREKALLTREQRIAAARNNKIADGELLPAADVEIEIAALIKSFAGFLEVLPFTLERECGLSGDVVERLQATIDQQRELLSERLSA
jgi:phage terminase Nu1 subunit (DNA packaging protein)